MREGAMTYTTTLRSVRGRCTMYLLGSDWILVSILADLAPSGSCCVQQSPYCLIRGHSHRIDLDVGLARAFGGFHTVKVLFWWTLTMGAWTRHIFRWLTLAVLLSLVLLLHGRCGS
jgi:hypothetical protein